MLQVYTFALKGIALGPMYVLQRIVALMEKSLGLSFLIATSTPYRTKQPGNGRGQILRKKVDEVSKVVQRHAPRLETIDDGLEFLWSDLGSCQNYGPFLGTLNIRCRIILGTQKGTIILTTTHLEAGAAMRQTMWQTASEYSASSRRFERLWLIGEEVLQAEAEEPSGGKRALPTRQARQSASDRASDLGEFLGWVSRDGTGGCGIRVLFVRRHAYIGRTGQRLLSQHGYHRRPLFLLSSSPPLQQKLVS